MADMYLGNESGGFDLVGTTNIKNIDFEEAKISKEDYENLSEEEQKTGIHLVTGLDDTENGGGSADLISYDNTNSGLGSTNVQGAIDELNSNIEWKFGGKVTGTTPILTPQDFKELIINIKTDTNEGYNMGYSLSFIKQQLETPADYFNGGAIGDSKILLQISVNLENIILRGLVFSATDYTANAEVSVYYR